MAALAPGVPGQLGRCDRVRVDEHALAVASGVMTSDWPDLRLDVVALIQHERDSRGGLERAAPATRAYPEQLETVGRAHLESSSA